MARCATRRIVTSSSPSTSRNGWSHDRPKGDSVIDRYSRKELRALWSDQRRYDTWLAVELAACQAMEEEGTVPKGTAERVRARAAGKLDPARILEIEEKTRHDVIAFLTHVEELAGEDAR